MSEPTPPPSRPDESAPRAPGSAQANDPSLGPDEKGTVPPPNDGPPEHPDVRFETTDVTVRPIVLVMLGTAMFSAVLFVVVWYFFAGYRDHQAAVKRSTFPLAEAPSAALPKEPRLEQVDRMSGVMTPDVYKREKARLKRLNGYGPTDDAGFIHVPIDRAMKLLAGKLPARAEPSADQKRRAGGLVDAGESNAGRMFRRGAK